MHVPAILPKRSVIAQESDEPSDRPTDDADVFSFSEYSGVQAGPSLPLESAAACLPKDFNRSHRAVFSQSITRVTWQGDTTLHEDILRKHQGEPTHQFFAYSPSFLACNTATVTLTFGL